MDGVTEEAVFAAEHKRADGVLYSIVERGCGVSARSWRGSSAQGCGSIGYRPRANWRRREHSHLR
jgi:hypothetical protein